MTNRGSKIAGTVVCFNPNSEITALNLSKTAFWDVDFSRLDYERQSRFILGKVFNYGTWADFLEMMHYYGRECVRAELVQAAYLKKKKPSFCCLLFDLKPEDFNCYTERQVNHPYWNF